MNRVETPQSRCLIGVSRCDVTPPVGIYHRMWGAAAHDRSTGVHRPLTATVLFLQSLANGSQALQVVIAIDHCLLWTTEMNRLLDSVSTATGVVREALIVFFSHTHAAGLMGLERQDLAGGELIGPYLDELVFKIAGLVVESQRRRTPATIVYGLGRCGMATHRDYFDENRGHFVCGFNPTGTADDTVVVGRVTDNAGSPIATIVNYACHPTTLAWENTLISPDFVGAMRDIVETATHVPCIFIQGASGDIGPREGFVGDVAVADRNGRQLGYAALAALESLPPAGHAFEYAGPIVSGATIGTWNYKPESGQRANQQSTWISQRDILPLKYRNDLPVRTDLEHEDAVWRADERDAISVGDIERARRSRALIERTTRRLTRIAHLPPGEAYPYPLIAWRIGDAVWVALEGEHYNLIQRTLRERFSDVPLIIGTLANGSNVWYLLDESSYGLGLYQEEVSILARGCLEAVLETATTAIRRLMADDVSQ